MNEAIRVHAPSGLFETGHPLSVIVEETSPNPESFSLKKVGGTEIVQIPLHPMPEHHVLQGDLLINLPGTYQIMAAGHSIEIKIEEHRDLGFFRQFGWFSIGVALIVGGMLVWLQKRKAPATKQI